mmetsp:Transcript_53507/g.174139  ORF Transcript_53507/g.174139 Transcript_53507/m.174139 type:complete len:240 (-) Transcript_53507:259-978(-)
MQQGPAVQLGKALQALAKELPPPTLAQQTNSVVCRDARAQLREISDAERLDSGIKKQAVLENSRGPQQIRASNAQQHLHVVQHLGHAAPVRALLRVEPHAVLGRSLGAEIAKALPNLAKLLVNGVSERSQAAPGHDIPRSRGAEKLRSAPREESPEEPLRLVLVKAAAVVEVEAPGEGREALEGARRQPQLRGHGRRQRRQQLRAAQQRLCRQRRDSARRRAARDGQGAKGLAHGGAEQ